MYLLVILIVGEQNVTFDPLPLILRCHKGASLLTDTELSRTQRS
jgi:hypothetical protein